MNAAVEAAIRARLATLAADIEKAEAELATVTVWHAQAEQRLAEETDALTALEAERDALTAALPQIEVPGE